MVEKVVEAYPCNCIIIDFASVVLVDSEGVAAIMFSYHACAAKEIRLLACSIRPNVFEMLAKKGVTSLVEVFPNVHAALDAATEYTSLNQSRQQKAQSMESIFGDPAEESIQYNNS
jgi:anti-anti-sigma regulatory factor